MSAVPKPIYNADQYLSLEEDSEYRSQFYFGEIFAVAGASERHNLIAMNVSGQLYNQLRQRDCRAYQNDMRVKANSEFYTYPDIVIVCGEPEIERKKGHNLLNPTVLIEVLSPSTEKFDRGEKFRLYRLMPSLREYFLVSQDRANIEHYVRKPDNSWLFTEISDMDARITLPSIDCELSVADVFEKVDFTEETAD